MSQKSDENTLEGASPIDQLLYMMARLRDPETGCPWDQKQTFDTILPFTIEEVYEVADAIAKDDKTLLKEELGDLLLQVVFYAQIAKDEGSFEFDDIARQLVEKMVQRHPHVFPDGTLASRRDPAEIPKTTDIKNNWETIKHQQKRQSGEVTSDKPSILSGIPASLPALQKAVKLQHKAAKVGFDWPGMKPVLEKMREELAEVEEAVDHQDEEHIAEELGDLLFVTVNLARHLGKDPEYLLQKTNLKFENRFRYIETSLAKQNKMPVDASLEEMEALWQQSKNN